MHTNVIPVIHYETADQAMSNAERAFDAGCEGVFLIHMDGENELLSPSAIAIKARWPDKLVGINQLGEDPAKAMLANIANGLDMTWTDVQLTSSPLEPWTYAKMVRDALTPNPRHLLFTGVAFKHQSHDPNPELSARMAVKFGFVPTTSGPATGVAADVGKIARLREAVGNDAPLAIASGITPDNVHQYAPYLSHILVASGVSESFHEFDYEKLCLLRARLR